MGTRLAALLLLALGAVALARRAGASTSDIIPTAESASLWPADWPTFWQHLATDEINQPDSFDPIPDWQPYTIESTAPDYSYDERDDSMADWKRNDYPKYATAIRDAERSQGLPQNLLGRVLFQESSFRPEVIEGRERSSAGAVGIAQFMPLTGEDYGLVVYDIPRSPYMSTAQAMGRTMIADYRTNPHRSIAAAAKYLRDLYRQFGTWPLALMAYNWGPGNVRNHQRNAGAYPQPLQTSRYVAQIIADVPVA